MPIVPKAAIISALCASAAACGVIFETDFFRDGLSSWKFAALAFEEGRTPDPHLAPRLPGVDASTGKLYVDSAHGMLGFLPRAHDRPHRCALIGYHPLPYPTAVESLAVRFSPDAVIPSGSDAQSGLFALIRYRDREGFPQIARGALRAGEPGSADLSAAEIYQITGLDPTSLDSVLKLSPDAQLRALDNLEGVGFLYVSPVHGSDAGEPLLLPSAHCAGRSKRKVLAILAPDSAVYAGDSLRLWAADTGYAPIAWEWKRGQGEPIGSGNPLGLRLAEADTGRHSFSVRIRDADGAETESEPVIVPVRGPAPLVVRGPVPVRAEVGAPAVLRVRADGTPPLVYVWYRGDDPLPEARGDSLAFESAALIDAGEYRCVVTDRFGRNAQSRIARLEVESGGAMRATSPAFGTLTIGIKLGMNLSDFYQDMEPGVATSQSRLSFPLSGAYANVILLSGLSVQAEALWSRKGSRYTFAPNRATEVTLDYLELPLFLAGRLEHRRTGLSASATGGGYWALSLRAERRDDWGYWDGHSSPGYRSTDAGLLGGVRIGWGAFAAEIRYTAGLANIAPKGSDGVKMNGALSASFSMDVGTLLRGNDPTRKSGVSESSRG